MTLDDLAALAGTERLALMGAFHPLPGDGLPDRCATLVLLGPAEPGFWPHVTAAPEFADGAPDPLDRWSRRVIGGLACGIGAKALFPFGGPPWHPFHKWALRGGEVWESPVRLLVHARAGLFASFRGALALKVPLDLPPPPPNPCEGCAAPCLTACPVDALSPAGYDLAACHTYLDTGPDCMTKGCAARRACPVSRGYARLPEQSAYHMRQFHR